jgi:pyruvate formate lyase activating enzyme
VGEGSIGETGRVWGNNPVDDRHGLIFDIQRYSIHDGSGIRTLVFMKGCPLHCRWCCNPESQSTIPELALFPSRCIGCGSCREACQDAAVTPEESGGFVTDRSLCQTCGRCVEACPTDARVLRGRRASVADVLSEVERDQIFYRTSGGGVTISGGEPLLQATFTAALLKACRDRGIDTAIETCGQAPWEDFTLVLAHTDSVLFDIKHVDTITHRRLTGVGNELIFANLRRVARSGARVVLRLALVPGYNADADSVRGVAALARELAIAELHLLPYHRLGESKYRALGRSYPLQDFTALSVEEIHGLKRLAEDGTGLSVHVGG